MGRDPIVAFFPNLDMVISIHSPRMGRDIDLLLATTRGKFQSTLPAWGETVLLYRCSKEEQFQSTLPAWGETGLCDLHAGHVFNFNPLSPHGERHNG